MKPNFVLVDFSYEELDESSINQYFKNMIGGYLLQKEGI